MPLGTVLSGIRLLESMRNRAKCKLCQDIIESKDRCDFVWCKCGEIAVDGGRDYFKATARNFENFLRIGDDGDEIEVIYQEKTKDLELVDPESSLLPKERLSREQLLDMLESTLKSIESLP